MSAVERAPVASVGTAVPISSDEQLKIPKPKRKKKRGPNAVVDGEDNGAAEHEIEQEVRPTRSPAGKGNKHGGKAQQQQQATLQQPTASVTIRHYAPPSPAADRAIVEVPVELAEWAQDANGACQEVLLAVKEQSRAFSVRVEELQDGSKCISVSAPSAGEAGMARALLATHLSNQLELLQLQARSQSRQQDVTSYHMQISSGLRVHFTVDEKFLGMMIGRQGVRIKEIQASTGCNIIVADGGSVSITGPSPGAARQARELMEFTEERVTVEPWQATLLRRSPGKLSDIARDSTCTLVRAEHAAVLLVGTKSGVASARMLLDVNIGYLKRRAAILEEDQQLRERLQELRVDYGGYRGGNRSGGGGNRGGQGGNSRARNQQASPRDGGSDGGQSEASSKQQQQQPQRQGQQPGEMSPVATSPPSPPPQEQEEPQQQEFSAEEQAEPYEEEGRAQADGGQQRTRPKRNRRRNRQRRNAQELGEDTAEQNQQASQHWADSPEDGEETKPRPARKRPEP